MARKSSTLCFFVARDDIDRFAFQDSLVGAWNGMATRYPSSRILQVTWMKPGMNCARRANRAAQGCLKGKRWYVGAFWTFGTPRSRRHDRWLKGKRWSVGVFWTFGTRWSSPMIEKIWCVFDRDWHALCTWRDGWDYNVTWSTQATLVMVETLCPALEAFVCWYCPCLCFFLYT